jgi:hypothetical protein
MRRAVALLAIIMSMASRAEAVIGEVRDADIHRETAVEAWTHAQDPHGAHAHDGAHPIGESGAESVQGTDDESPHEHGGSSDHCTHVHGAMLVGSMEWSPVPTEVSFDSFLTSSSSGVAPQLRSPPPRL